MVAIAVGGFIYPVTYLPQYSQMVKQVEYQIILLKPSTSTSLCFWYLLILEEATECTYTKKMKPPIAAGHMLSAFRNGYLLI